MARSRLARRARHARRNGKKTSPSSSPAKRNPPTLNDMAGMVLPSFGAYGGTRLIGRITQVQVAKRWPRWAKHAAALSSLVSFGAAWVLAHRVKAVARYHTPIVIGAGVASLQTLVQTYLPWLGWMTADVQPGDLKLAAPAQRTQPQMTASGGMGMGHTIFDEADAMSDHGAPEWGTYNDAFDQGRQAAPAAPESTDEAAADHSMDEMLADLDVDDGMGNGIFAN